MNNNSEYEPCISCKEIADSQDTACKTCTKKLQQETFNAILEDETGDRLTQIQILAKMRPNGW